MRHKADCPKCGSPHAWYEKDTYDLSLVCFCGYRKVVFTTLETLEVEHNARPQEVSLPRKGTQLFRTLTALEALEPATSKEVTDLLVLRGGDYTVSDVSSYLMLLRSRGLVNCLEYRRGYKDGSTWECTEAALELLGLTIGDGNGA